MSTMNFGASSLASDNLPPQLNVPYIGPMQLLSFERDKDFRDQGYDVMIWTFKLSPQGETADKSPVAKGTQYRHIEWCPKDEDDLQKVKNLVQRIGYITKYFVGEEKAMQATNIDADISEGYAELWEKLYQNFGRIYAETDTEAKMDLRGKINGSVYKGKERLSFPNYLGFLSHSESEQDVSLSRSEVKGNNQYMQVFNQKPDDMASQDTSAVETGGDEFGEDPLGF